MTYTRNSTYGPNETVFWQPLNLIKYVTPVYRNNLKKKKKLHTLEFSSISNIFFQTKIKEMLDFHLLHGLLISTFISSI